MTIYPSGPELTAPPDLEPALPNEADDPDEPGAKAWLARAGIAVLVAAGCATAWFATVDPTYAATSSVYVKSGRNDAAAVFSQGLYEQNRLQSYAALAHSTLVTGAAAERAGVDLTATELADAVTVQVLPQTVIIAITVEDPNADRARELSIALAESVVDQGNLLEEEGSAGTSPVSLVVFDRAEEPGAPSAPDRLRVAALSVLLGAVAGLVVPLPRRLGRRRPYPTASDHPPEGAVE